MRKEEWKLGGGGGWVRDTAGKNMGKTDHAAIFTVPFLQPSKLYTFINICLFTYQRKQHDTQRNMPCDSRLKSMKAASNEAIRFSLELRRALDTTETLFTAATTRLHHYCHNTATSASQDNKGACKREKKLVQFYLPYN